MPGEGEEEEEEKKLSEAELRGRVDKVPSPEPDSNMKKLLQDSQQTIKRLQEKVKQRDKTIFTMQKKIIELDSKVYLSNAENQKI